MKQKFFSKLSQEELFLKQQVDDVQRDLNIALHKFENTTEPDLLDYYSYIYKAHMIKHGYLLNKLKQLYYN
ncbi:MAG: DUF2508 domain-containing protein [Candidatus Epulonipiscioides saccharophilum]|nr:MAG: DUF2508 domain-containing protein [Epulopiscium sp. AS2M-Bin001]